MLRKLLSITIVVLMLTSYTVPGASEEKIIIDYLFDGNFETDEIGENPWNSTCVPSDGKIYTDYIPGTNSKAVKLEAIQNGTVTVNNMRFGFKIEPSLVFEDNIVLEFDVYYEKFGAANIDLETRGPVQGETVLLRFDSNGVCTTFDGQRIQQLSEDKLFRFSIAYDITTYTGDVYIDHRLVATDIKFSNELKSLSLMLPYMRNLVGKDEPIVYYDNFRGYYADMPQFQYENNGVEISDEIKLRVSGVATDDDVAKYMKNTVCLYVGQNTVAVNGEVTKIDSGNPDVKTFVVNGRSFVPIRVISDYLGYEVTWNEKNGEVVIVNDEKKIVFTIGKNTFRLDGREIPLEEAARIENGRAFVPVRALCEAFGKKLTYDACGLIVIADRENFFNYRNDLGVYRKLGGDMVYRNPSPEYLVEKIKENFPNNGHPRIMFNQAQLDEIIRGTEVNSMMAKWKQDIIKKATGYMDKEPVKWEPTATGYLLAQQREFGTRIDNIAFAFLLTKDEKFLNRAKEELLAVAAFEDWGPYHFLDCAEFMAAVGRGYDWLYHWLTEEERTIIKDAIVEKGLNEIVVDYTVKQWGLRSNPWAFAEQADNWSIVNDACGIMAAFAIADEAEDISREVLGHAMEHIKKPMVKYGPDGIWFEGATYWEFAMKYFTMMVSSFKAIYGDAFGYTQTPGMNKLGDYLAHFESADQMINLGDASSQLVNSPEMFFMAEETGMRGWTATRLKRAKESSMSADIRDLIYYNWKVDVSEATLERDAYFRDTEVVTMRSGWSASSSIYAAMHGGLVGAYHGQCDVGQFFIDGYGYRYALDVGIDTYSDPEQYLQYRYRAEGHNTLVINPSMDPGQDRKGNGTFERFESNNNGSLAVLDMTSAYVEHANSARRGMKLTNNRSNIIIQDEISFKEPSELFWFLHTLGKITIAEDGLSAKIEGKYKDLYVYLLEDVGATFYEMKAEHLPTAYPSKLQNSNEGTRKIVLHFENITEKRIPVCFSFESKANAEPELYRPEVVSLDDWQLDEEKEYTLPALTDLRVNGKTIENFEPENTAYTFRFTEDDDAPILEADSEDTVEIKMPENGEGYAIVTVRSKDNPDFKNIYTIELVRITYTGRPEGTVTLLVKNVEASSVPQMENGPRNTIDLSYFTRWSAQGRDVTITLELENMSMIECIGLAHWQSGIAGRQQYFDVEISEDGLNYKKLYEGGTSGEVVDDMEFFPIEPTKGKYVRITGKGTSHGDWTSILELAAFGKKIN